jgi:hypothetical protein
VGQKMKYWLEECRVFNLINISGRGGKVQLDLSQLRDVVISDYISRETRPVRVTVDIQILDGEFRLVAETSVTVIPSNGTIEIRKE